MKILHFFFNLLEPENSKYFSFLSRSFSRWKSDKQEKQNARYKKNAKDNLFFEVAGAGEISIGKSCFGHTGRSFGFDFGVSWGRFGYCGGILDREQAKQLADFIISEYEKVTPEKKVEEQNYLKEQDERLKEYFATKN